MATIDITNYDVLVSPPIPGKSEEYQLDRVKNHAGNNRLEVFLNLHRSSYDAARSRADFGECDNIVDKIVATVCHQCVPKGRFLVSSLNGATGSVFWNQMDEQNAKLFLHSVLRPITPPLPPPPTPPMQPSLEEKKRRRRSSLLRRSASESMVLSVLDSKKKLSKMKIGGVQEEPEWTSTSSGGLTLRRMDVMLADGALDPNSQSVGNNRLHVLIAMNAAKYQNASIEEKEKVLNEVVQTVKIWTGRFLVQGDNGPEEVEKEAAMNALRNIFDMRAGQAGHKPRFSLPNPSLVRASSQPVAAPPTSLGRQSSASMINSGPDVNMPELETLRLAAVNNLKKKKARQKIASRLEDQTGRGGSLNQQTAPTPSRTSVGGPIAPLPTAASLNGQRPQPIAPAGGRPPMASLMGRRQSSVFGGLSPDLMNELAAGIDDIDTNNRDPLPPTPSNEFTTRFM